MEKIGYRSSIEQNPPVKIFQCAVVKIFEMIIYNWLLANTKNNQTDFFQFFSTI